MQTVLLIIQIIVAVSLIIVVLLQRSEGGALGMGGGGSGLGGLFSPRGAADTLTRTTAILGILFFLSSLGLTVLALRGSTAPTSILDTQPAGPAKVLPLQPAPKKDQKPSVPSTP
ncbi:MAG: preprotein translocase subunit SecG [Proteobacteria bacterium]|nr:preprotein translocase subunit SecG [Pseudomonadota bacterium]